MKMNIQAMMKQAQKLQKDMLNAKEEIDKTIFEAKSSFVTVKANGKREILNIKIDMDSIEKADIEMLEDMIQVAINDVMKQIEKETENKMGRYTQGMPGLF
jgi:DNA-binding YbaB/EbfC family protein